MFPWERKFLVLNIFAFIAVSVVTQSIIFDKNAHSSSEDIYAINKKIVQSEIESRVKVGDSLKRVIEQLDDAGYSHDDEPSWGHEITPDYDITGYLLGANVVIPDNDKKCEGFVIILFVFSRENVLSDYRVSERWHCAP